MDVYSKTWLQFVFPVYILVLVGLVIIINHFVHVDAFAKLLGNNSVSVLATRNRPPVRHKDPSHMYIDYLCFMSLTIYLTYNRMVHVHVYTNINTDYLTTQHIPSTLPSSSVYVPLSLSSLHSLASL